MLFFRPDVPFETVPLTGATNALMAMFVLFQLFSIFFNMIPGFKCCDDIGGDFGTC